ncbi:MAG: FAD:protein FMN transferase [Chitinophagaceae bacterium]|nr:FAD:protein FMN transferase [Chitinophagaceae bacterium]
MKMGSAFNLIIVSTDSNKANHLARKSFELVDSLNHIFSNYDSSSEISKINASAGLLPYKISPAMLDLVQKSQDAYIQSKGAYDISIGPLSTLWRNARKAKLFPDASTVIATKKLVGLAQVKINKRLGTIFLPNAGMQLDFGGIAKGYIAGRIINYLKANGIQQALAEAGGDIVMSGAPLNSKGWIIGVNLPQTTDDLVNKKLQLSNCAAATSGDVYQYFEKEGVKYSHIINPLTGYGVTNLRNVTIIAKTGATADWLATACSILPIKEAKTLALSNHAALLISTLQKGKLHFEATENFKNYWQATGINQGKK